MFNFTGVRKTFKFTTPQFITLSIGILCILLRFFPIQFNYTSSMPIGFYKQVRVSKINRGDLVSVCLPEKIAAVALQRGYLRAGRCPSRVIPVLKKVIAVPGDTVALNNKNITVNGITYVAPFIARDHHNEPLKKFITNGIFQLRDGYWIYGANDAVNSWDSRYYGAVAREAIIGVYKPLLTFKNKDFVKPYPLSRIH